MAPLTNTKSCKMCGKMPVQHVCQPFAILAQPYYPFNMDSFCYSCMCFLNALSSKLSHYNKVSHLIYFPTGTVAEGAPIIPISAQLKYNIEVVCEYIVNKIPVPVRDFTSEPRLIGKRPSILPKRTRCALWQSLDEQLCCFFLPQ